MYTGNRLLMRLMVPAFVAQILIMIISLSVSLPRVTATPHCVEANFPVAIIAYRCVRTLCSSRRRTPLNAMYLQYNICPI